MFAIPVLLRRLIVLGAAALFMLLISGSHAEAGGRPMRAWTRLMFGFERVCKDGIRFGMANSLDKRATEKEYRFEFVIKKANGQIETLPLYGDYTGIRLDEINDGSFSSPNCNPAPVNGNNPTGFPINYCDGPFTVYWGKQLSAGDGANEPEQLDLYVWERDISVFPDEYEESDVFPLSGKSIDGFNGLIVADCNVDDAAMEIIQTAPGSTGARVTDALTFQAHAFDPDIGVAGNNEIDRVQLKLVDANGATLHEVVDRAAPYCAFGGDLACAVWNFQDRRYTWPGGQPIQSGSLTLAATAFRRYGSGSTTMTKEINIDLPADIRPLNVAPLATAISAGGNYTCAVAPGGNVKCWGDNSNGQLGNDTLHANRMPAVVRRMGSTVKGVSAGLRHICAVTEGGGVKCWGNNSAGQLGTGDNSDRLGPVDVAGLASGVTAVSAGDSHTCAITDARGVKCWGDNTYGQLGNGAFISSTAPVDVSGLGDVVAIDVGAQHSCALTNTGDIKCWGRNDFGQLGSGSTASSNLPVTVQGLTGARAVNAGSLHTCAITSAGGGACWGDNRRGQLGNGATLASAIPVAVQGLASGAAAVSAGSRHTCAVLDAGGVKCWGENSSGQLGNGATLASLTPVDVVGLTSRTQAVSVGTDHTCILSEEGMAKCWGRSIEGQLGLGDKVRRSVPAGVPGLESGVAGVSSGRRHTCVITGAGGVKCWGANATGQLGDGSGQRSGSPVEVQALAGVAALSAGDSHTCALTGAGGLHCWGGNQAGQLGNGGNTNQLAPVAVTGLSSGVSAVVARLGAFLRPAQQRQRPVLGRQPVRPAWQWHIHRQQHTGCRNRPEPEACPHQCRSVPHLRSG